MATVCATQLTINLFRKGILEKHLVQSVRRVLQLELQTERMNQESPQETTFTVCFGRSELINFFVPTFKVTLMLKVKLIEFLSSVES